MRGAGPPVVGDASAIVTAPRSTLRAQAAGDAPPPAKQGALVRQASRWLGKGDSSGGADAKSIEMAALRVVRAKERALVVSAAASRGGGATEDPSRRAALEGMLMELSGK